MNLSHGTIWSVGQRLMFLVILIFAIPVSAQNSVTVGDASALEAALEQAEPGTVIELTEGSYGPLTIKGIEAREDARIIVRSAPDTGPVNFSRLELVDSSFVSLNGLVFDYDFAAGDNPKLRPFEVINSRGVEISNNLFDGDSAQNVSEDSDGFGTAFGLSVRGSADTLVADNEIRTFYRGFLAAQSGGLIVRGNEIHDIRMDGMNFAQVQAVVIEDNFIHSFNRSLNSADHADMIQFWTNGTDVPSSDIVIRNNVLNSGSGGFSQSIFMRNDLVDRGLAGQEMFYRDITIENNVVINAHLNGITVGETDGLTIRNNTVLHNSASDGAKDDPGLWTPQIRSATASRNVSIVRNITSVVAGYEGQLDWVVRDNLLVQDRDPNIPNYYDTYFLAARTGNPMSLLSFSYLPASGLDGKQIGAPQLVKPPAPDTLLASAQALEVAPFVNRFTFDATSTIGPADLVNEKTRYEWQIEGEPVQEGSRITHTFTTYGNHGVKLRVTPENGAPAETSVFVHVPNPDIVTFAASKGVFTAWNGANSNEAIGTPAVIGPAILNSGRARISIERADLEPFFSARDFDLGLRIRADKTMRSEGELLRIHKTLVLTVTGRGGLEIDFSTITARPLRINTPALRLLDGEWHDIRVVYSSGQGRVEVFVDDRLVGAGNTQGIIRPVEHWGLELGNPFNNRKSFDGMLERLYLRANVEGFAQK